MNRTLLVLFCLALSCLTGEVILNSSDNGNTVYQIHAGNQTVKRVPIKHFFGLGTTWDAIIFIDQPSVTVLKISEHLMQIEPDKKMIINEALVNNDGLVVGVYYKDGDNGFQPRQKRMFALNGNTGEFFDLPPPRPKYWQHEAIWLNRIDEKGEAFYRLRLSLPWHTFACTDKDSFAEKFSNVIECSYNFHSKIFKYFLLENGAQVSYWTLDNITFNKS